MLKKWNSLFKASATSCPVSTCVVIFLQHSYKWKQIH